MTVPTDYLHKRKKVPEVSPSARKAAKENAATAAANAENIKKQQSIVSQKTQTKQAKSNQQKAEREKISRDLIEVQTEREDCQNVEFSALFTDNLPQKAIELRQYDQGMKEKDSDGVAKTAEQIIKAKEALEQVKKIATHQQPFYLMVSDIITPPKGVQMVRP